MCYCIADNFTEGDETLMKAKINFTATVVGSHPNVVKFIGAVVDDPASKNHITFSASVFSLILRFCHIVNFTHPFSLILYEPGYSNSYKIAYAPSKDLDQPAPIRGFGVRLKTLKILGYPQRTL